MKDETKDYDEPAELTKYIWRNYRHLRTEDEQLAEHAFSVEGKFGGKRYSDGPNPRLLEERKRYENNAFVQEALRQGDDWLQVTVRDRILREMPPSFFINRCPSCQKVVSTPKAEQCLWCGHDWHSSEG